MTFDWARAQPGNKSLDELERLVRQINTTNATTRLADGSTLTEALARRDVLRLRHGLLTAVWGSPG